MEVGGRVSQAMQAFRTFLGESDMLAYLSMMAPRLVELRRVLKTTGSLYLHLRPDRKRLLTLVGAESRVHVERTQRNQADGSKLRTRHHQGMA